MTRRRLAHSSPRPLRAFAVAAAIAGAAGLPSAHAADVTLTLSSWVPPNHALTRSQLEWCQEVSKATSSRIKCNQLAKPVAPPPGTFDAVRDGLADVSFGVHGYTPGRYVLTQLVELPFLGGESAETTSLAYQTVYDKYLAKLNEHKGLKVLAVFTHGPGNVFNSKRPIEKIEDFDGLKIRVGGGMVNDIGKAIGVNITLKPASQAYELLSSGVMDGVFFPAESVKGFKLEKLIKYRTDFPGGLYNTSFAIVMNPATWAKISKEDQATITKLSGPHIARMFGKAWDNDDRVSSAYMQAEGIQTIKADKAFTENVRKRTAFLQDKWIKEAKAKGLANPEQVLKEYTALATK
ncbi:MAG: TRAP transporter substrate-binding protein [Lautropia sp.]